MAFNNLTSRGEVVMPVQYMQPMVEGIRYQSAAMKLFRRAPNMSTGTVKIPVLQALPMAYFTGGDTGLKQTTEMNWQGKDLVAEELAAIMPIPEAVLNDANFNIWEQARHELEGAIARAIDNAIFFNINKPSTWPTALVAAAVAIGNVVERGTNDVEDGGVMGDISDLMSMVEADGFSPTGFATDEVFKRFFRKARDKNGQRYLDIDYTTDANGNRVTRLEGLPVEYMMEGLWPNTGENDAELITGDWRQGIFAIREDITVKILDQAVITDNANPPNIIFNLPQQDMIALRITFRCAWQVSNRVNYREAVEANRYPWAVLRSPNIP